MEKGEQRQQSVIFLIRNDSHERIFFLKNSLRKSDTFSSELVCRWHLNFLPLLSVCRHGDVRKLRSWSYGLPRVMLVFDVTYIRVSSKIKDLSFKLVDHVHRHPLKKCARFPLTVFQKKKNLRVFFYDSRYFWSESHQRIFQSQCPSCHRW